MYVKHEMNYPIRVLVLFFASFLALWIYATSFQDVYSFSIPKLGSSISKTESGTKAPRVRKVSVLYGERNEYYERAVQTHVNHAHRHGYPIDVLHNPVATGYWNKIEFLLSMTVQELGKDPDERAEWLMWFDADSCIINPSIPLEVFLPPKDMDHIHFLATKDQNGLNTGIFFSRVSEWSVNMFTTTLGFPTFRPDIDLGVSADQKAMEILFNQTEVKDGVLYQPRTWYNTYEFHHGYEGHKGDFLVHFPGLEDDRWNHMGEWLDRLESDQARDWDIAVEQTHYPETVKTYWTLLGDVERTLRMAERRIEESDDISEDLIKSYEHLKDVAWNMTDDVDIMIQAIKDVTIAIFTYRE